MDQRVKMAGLGAVLLVGAALMFFLLAADEAPTSFDDRFGRATPGERGSEGPDDGGGDPTAAPTRPAPDSGPRLRPPNDADQRPTPSPAATPFDPRRPGPGPGPGDDSASGAVTVVFQARDAEGNPLQNVRIEAKRESGAPLEPVVTDASGQAALSGLPSGERIQGVGHHARSALGSSFGPVAVGPRTVVELRFADSALGRLKGRIVDDRGEPVTDAQLLLKDPRQEGEKVLDATEIGLGPDGSFYATAAAGQYAVTAAGEGLSRSDTTYVTIPTDGEADAGQLVVYRQGTLAGTVSLPGDLQTVLPVELDLVLEVTRGDEANPYQHTRRVPLQIDANLRWEVPDCDPGDYRLRLERPEAGGNRVGPWAQITLTPGARAEGIDLSIKEVSVSLRGVVRDDRGDPVPGARVSVNGRGATTDRDGRYAIRGLDLGDLGIEATADGHASAYQQVTYQGGELSLDLVLPRTGGVRGTIEGPAGPAPRVPVQVVQRTDGGIVRPHQAVTDAQGGFLIEGLPPGEYYIVAGRGADPFDDAGAPSFSIFPGEVVEAPRVTVD